MKYLGRGAGLIGLRASPPTRGAWIEIVVKRIAAAGIGVAPHTGGVD